MILTTSSDEYISYLNFDYQSVGVFDVPSIVSN